jgi:hypothetical protein
MAGGPEATGPFVFTRIGRLRLIMMRACQVESPPPRFEGEGQGGGVDKERPGEITLPTMIGTQT